MDEYVAQEQDDMLEALTWIAAQPWCTGSIGMIGISWGGFSGLQVAMRRPPELKAVVTLCSTDDRYADDVHYMGGCLLRNNLAWGGQSLAYSARPPDPMVVGDGWRDMWGAAPGKLAVHHSRMDVAPDARCLLAPWLGQRGMGCYRMSGLRGDGLGGWLHQYGAAG